MSDTKVANIRIKELRKTGYVNFQEWSKDPNHIYIGRDMTCYVPGTKGSKWANPYKVPRDGTVDQVLTKYEQHIRNSPRLMASLSELQGKILGCWCHPGPCHGDILVKMSREANNHVPI